MKMKATQASNTPLAFGSRRQVRHQPLQWWHPTAVRTVPRSISFNHMHELNSQAQPRLQPTHHHRTALVSLQILKSNSNKKIGGRSVTKSQVT